MALTRVKLSGWTLRYADNISKIEVSPWERNESYGCKVASESTKKFLPLLYNNCKNQMKPQHEVQSGTVCLKGYAQSLDCCKEREVIAEGFVLRRKSNVFFIIIIRAAIAIAVCTMQLFPRPQNQQQQLLHIHMAKREEVDQKELACCVSLCTCGCTISINNFCSIPQFFPELIRIGTKDGTQKSMQL